MSQLMSSMKLAIYPSIALFLFLAVFLGVLWMVLRSSRSQMSSHASIPLDDEPVTPRSPKP